MMDKDAKELVSEIKKIRGDMDKVQAYIKTVAEQNTIIATQVGIIAENTTPAVEPTTEPAGSGEGEPSGSGEGE